MHSIGRFILNKVGNIDNVLARVILLRDKREFFSLLQ